MEQQIEVSARHVAAVNCYGCGQVGSALWEDRPRDGAQGAKLIVLSNGFHCECGQSSGSPTIICDHCDSQAAA